MRSKAKKMVCDLSGPCLPQLNQDRTTHSYKITASGCCLFCGVDLNTIIEELDGIIKTPEIAVH
jgi:hypothetical protein